MSALNLFFPSWKLTPTSRFFASLSLHLTVSRKVKALSSISASPSRFDFNTLERKLDKLLSTSLISEI
jgi:hypothetical protein